MKRTIALAFFASTMFMALTSASAQGRAKATIPFEFRVGSALMPAGSYVIEYSDTNKVWFRNQDGRETAVALANTSTGDVVPPAKLVFNKYGERYFLSETLAANGHDAMTFVPTKLEKSIRSEEASNQAEGRVLIALK
jgi:hypothetical protein